MQSHWNHGRRGKYIRHKRKFGTRFADLVTGVLINFNELPFSCRLRGRFPVRFNLYYAKQGLTLPQHWHEVPSILGLIWYQQQLEFPPGSYGEGDAELVCLYLGGKDILLDTRVHWYLGRCSNEALDRSLGECVLFCTDLPTCESSSWVIQCVKSLSSVTAFTRKLVLLIEQWNNVKKVWFKLQPIREVKGEVSICTHNRLVHPCLLYAVDSLYYTGFKYILWSPRGFSCFHTSSVYAGVLSTSCASPHYIAMPGRAAALLLGRPGQDLDALLRFLSYFCETREQPGNKQSSETWLSPPFILHYSFYMI